MSPNSPPLDAVFLIKTPENIAFQYGVAGPFRRVPAFLIDLAFRWAVVFGVILLFMLLCVLVEAAFGIVLGQTLGGATFFPFLAAGTVIMFVMEWFFAGFCEAYFNGQTVGKWLLGLRVVTVEGQPINGLQAVMRNVIRFADLLPPLTGLIVMASNRRYQRLGDLVCGTMVITEEKPWLTTMAKLDDARAIQLAAYIPADFVVSRTLAKALSTYVERRRFFAVKRRTEMARHIAPGLLERFGLPSDTSYDLLLCAIYYRTFIADRRDDEKFLAAASAPTQTTSPVPNPYLPTPAPAPVWEPLPTINTHGGSR